MSQIAHFYGVKFSAWKSGGVEFFTIIMSVEELKNSFARVRSPKTLKRRLLLQCYTNSNTNTHVANRNVPGVLSTWRFRYFLPSTLPFPHLVSPTWLQPGSEEVKMTHKTRLRRTNCPTACFLISHFGICHTTQLTNTNIKKNKTSQLSWAIKKASATPGPRFPWSPRPRPRAPRQRLQLRSVGGNLRMVEVSQLKNRIPPACQGEVAPKETQMFGRKVTSKSANW